MDGWVGYLSGVYQHVGSRFTQIGDQLSPCMQCTEEETLIGVRADHHP